MRRHVLARLAAALWGLAVALSGCDSGQPGGGGLVTPPPPVSPSPNPSAPPIGDPIRTGVTIAGSELVVYFWGSAQPYLDEFWYGPNGAEDGPYSTVFAGAHGQPFLDMREIIVGDGTLIDYGSVRGPVGRLHCEAEGETVAASFTPWSADRSVYVFWLVRHGRPLPAPTLVREGLWLPLADEDYPLCTAYDADGKALGNSRIKPPGAEQKGG
ncbi:hypothetical protein Cme02nite_64700 [Catellatospora methionotrophica]|uniref:Lipoprotein n=1 Tax=Catellatospora methionotrophica TaxID=121620 RepID=A0A8J3PJ43_9ACTN|nr:hypothetical protein [Catellatospora methionotrophica]GIG18138.1 hypothetical protein Cme02nite_64700 [Catellatospora methionotrophica]